MVQLFSVSSLLLSIYHNDNVMLRLPWRPYALENRLTLYHQFVVFRERDQRRRSQVGIISANACHRKGLDPILANHHRAGLHASLHQMSVILIAVTGDL